MELLRFKYCDFSMQTIFEKVTLKALAGSQNSFDMILRGLEQSSGVSPAL